MLDKNIFAPVIYYLQQRISLFPQTVPRTMCSGYGTVSINLHEWCVMNNDQCGMSANRAHAPLWTPEGQEQHSSEWSDAAIYPARGGDDPLSQWGLFFVYTCVYSCLGNGRPAPSRGRATPPWALLCVAEGRILLVELRVYLRFSWVDACVCVCSAYMAPSKHGINYRVGLLLYVTLIFINIHFPSPVRINTHPPV